MNNDQIMKKTIERYKKSTGDDRFFVPTCDIIAFLEKEIDEYREDIKQLNERINSINSGEYFAQFETVTQYGTIAEAVKMLSDNGYNISINLFKDNEREV